MYYKLISYFRSVHINELLKPLNTVLDDSIGCALWFAARGRGVINTCTEEERRQKGVCTEDMNTMNEDYVSPARVSSLC